MNIIQKQLKHKLTAVGTYGYDIEVIRKLEVGIKNKSLLLQITTDPKLMACKNLDSIKQSYNFGKFTIPQRQLASSYTLVSNVLKIVINKDFI